MANSAGGRLQHDGDGQPDRRRRWVSAPRNHFACWNGTPTVTANSPPPPGSPCAVQKNVPLGGSVYCGDGAERSAEANTRRLVYCRQASCPSIAPLASVG